MKLKNVGLRDKEVLFYVTDWICTEFVMSVRRQIALGFRKTYRQ